jgi:hypothetical protein
MRRTRAERKVTGGWILGESGETRRYDDFFASVVAIKIRFVLATYCTCAEDAHVIILRVFFPKLPARRRIARRSFLLYAEVAGPSTASTSSPFVRVASGSRDPETLRTRHSAG